MKKSYKTVKKPCSISFFSHLADFGGCGHIRVIFPAMIMNSFHDKELQLSSLYSNRYIPFKGVYDKTNFTIFQRSASASHLVVARHFLTHNRRSPMIYEIDDHLLDIPEWNRASGYYKENRDNIKKILDIVPFVTVSTDALKREMRPYCNTIRVIPNHLPKFLWKTPTDNTKETKRVKILYAGSDSHFDIKDDRGDFPLSFINFIKKTSKKYEWIFVGGCPQSLKDNDDISLYAWRSILELPDFLKAMKVDIALASLDDNVFNDCKSNIKALESVCLGVPLVATSVGPYKGLYGACHSDELFHTISLLAASEDKRRLTWEKQYEQLKSQLFWEDNNYKNLRDFVDSHLRFIGIKL